MFNKVIQFIKEAKAELTKVNWPTKKQATRYTVLVIGISLAVAAFLGGLDYIFGVIIRNFLIKQ